MSITLTRNRIVIKCNDGCPDMREVKLAFANMSPEQMRHAVKALEEACFNNEKWAKTFHSALIFRLKPDEGDISCDAHRMCLFGQWYYTEGKVALERHPGFAKIGLEHECMHQIAGSLLRSSVDGIPISISDYERFISAMTRMRSETETIKRELEDALYNRDPLTGTPSRAGMLTKLSEQLELVRRNVHACAIAMIDLDEFKAVNDNYGHLVGDRVLIAVARYLMTHLRPYDRVFRYGGEEFLVCLPGANLEAGRDLIYRLCGELGSLPHEADDKRTFQVTASFGLTLLAPQLPVEQSIDRADKALYAAKAKGGNRAVIWNESMGERQAEPEGSA
jgi:diguanylate cyclase